MDKMLIKHMDQFPYKGGKGSRSDPHYDDKMYGYDWAWTMLGDSAKLSYYKLTGIQTEVNLLWGVKMDKDVAQHPHAHPGDGVVFFVYYTNVPDNCSPIIVGHHDTHINPSNGMLLFFSANTIHSVPKGEFEGYRYSFPGSLVAV
jgi:hypothetical protein